ncbi:MAG: hypothetical protein ACLR8Y_22940 [Alistipes indistinctus]
MEGILRYDDPLPEPLDGRTGRTAERLLVLGLARRIPAPSAGSTPHNKSCTFSPPYHASGYKDGLRYRALNLLCELDTPGEWYIDRAKGLLYWYPSVEASYDNRVALTVSMLRTWPNWTVART